MLKKVIISFSTILIILTLSVFTVFADAGPKPSFEISFSGVENNSIAAIISDEEEFGNWRAFDIKSPDLYDEISGGSDIYSNHLADNLDAFIKRLSEYKPSDKYRYISYTETVSDKTGLSGTYLPNSFKIILYSPKSNKLSVSEKTNCYGLFSKSKYKVNVKKGEITSVSTTSSLNSSYNRFIVFIKYLVSLIFTLGIEILIALIMKINTKHLILTITATNIISLTAMSMLIYIINPPVYGTLFSFPYAFFEIGVTIAEIIAYMILFPKYEKEVIIPKQKIIIYTVLANAATYALAEVLPKISIL